MEEPMQKGVFVRAYNSSRAWPDKQVFERTEQNPQRPWTLLEEGDPTDYNWEFLVAWSTEIERA